MLRDLLEQVGELDRLVLEPRIDQIAKLLEQAEDARSFCKSLIVNCN